ncbi:MAG: Do family serine endopeptidase [Fibrobacterota bacterium]|nr:Do family serine endopeptidase [Fibrobacterota bacterium]
MEILKFLFIALAAGAIAASEARVQKTQGKKDDAGSGRFMADRDECRDVFADVAEKIIPSVVSITTRKRARSPDEEDLSGADRERNPRGDGLGSGVIVGPHGYILTNNHVTENARTLRVRLSDDREFDAEVIAADKTSDVSVIRLKGKPGNLPALPLGDSDKLRVGEWVVAVGSPYGLSETVTTGIVSAKGRRNPENPYANFIQTDAAINPGNSGGALVNLDGELIGINTAIVSQSGGYQGIGLAIPSNLAKKVMQELVKDGSVTRGWLGISVQTVTESLVDAMDLKARKGALVTSVSKDGPGGAGGLKRGDVIVRLDDAEIKDADGLLDGVANLKPGKEVDLTLMRGIKTMEVTVKVGKKAEARAPREDSGTEGGLDDADGGARPHDRIGLQIADPDKGLRRRYHTGQGTGVVVLGVEDGSRAEAAGLKEGDFIVEADNRDVGNTKELQSAVVKARKKGKLVLRVKRGDEVFYAAVRFG